jgi:2-dehydro-3-deoxygalactonokinase
MTTLHRKAFLAVDWGTTALRLWVIGNDGRVLAERRSAEGMGKLARDQFPGVLRNHMAALAADLAGLPEPLPILMCGMVGSRQGWQEAPYVTCPTALSDLAGQAVSVAADGLDIRILPGLALRDPEQPEVMRGEETKLLALLADRPAFSGLVNIPGTHSKWVPLREGAVPHFLTFITGELFAVLSQHSLLRHSIRGAEATGDPENTAFKRGVVRGLAAPGSLAARLFSLRAGHLLFDISGGDTADHLSGLLIGSEVGTALTATQDTGPVTVLATGTLGRLYRAAILAAGRAVISVDSDEAVRGGLILSAQRIWPSIFEKAPA